MAGVFEVFFVLGLCISVALSLAFRPRRRQANRPAPSPRAQAADYAPKDVGLTISLVDQALHPARRLAVASRRKSRFRGRRVR